VRYALVAYGASWVVVVSVSLDTRLLFGVHQWSAAGALWFDAVWLASLVPLYRVGVLRAGDLGLRPAPAGRAVGRSLLAFVSLGVFDGIWHSVLAAGSASNPFSGGADARTALIGLTGLAAVLSPVVEAIFFQGLLFRCFRNRLTLLPASLIVGVLFAVVHTEYALVVLPELAVYGVVACVLYEYIGSLFPGMAIGLYLDASGFERALTGTASIVFWSFVSLVAMLLVRAWRDPLSSVRWTDKRVRPQPLSRKNTRTTTSVPSASNE
jgi:membrane protease YdiL (CAAX protease family)